MHGGVRPCTSEYDAIESSTNGYGFCRTNWERYVSYICDVKSRSGASSYSAGAWARSWPTLHNCPSNWERQVSQMRDVKSR